jgi:hypothetical protein
MVKTSISFIIPSKEQCIVFARSYHLLDVHAHAVFLGLKKKWLETPMFFFQAFEMVTQKNEPHL